MRRSASAGRPRSICASPGYRPTPEENQAFQELRTRRAVTNVRKDMEALREVNTALVVRTLESYARHDAEQHDEHGPPLRRAAPAASRSSPRPSADGAYSLNSVEGMFSEVPTAPVLCRAAFLCTGQRSYVATRT